MIVFAGICKGKLKNRQSEKEIDPVLSQLLCELNFEEHCHGAVLKNPAPSADRGMFFD